MLLIFLFVWVIKFLKKKTFKEDMKESDKLSSYCELIRTLLLKSNFDQLYWETGDIIVSNEEVEREHQRKFNYFSS